MDGVIETKEQERHIVQSCFFCVPKKDIDNIKVRGMGMQRIIGQAEQNIRVPHIL